VAGSDDPGAAERSSGAAPGDHSPANNGAAASGPVNDGAALGAGPAATA